MINTTGSMIAWLLFGFFLIFIGFLSIVTGFAQIISSDDVFFIVQIEDVIYFDSVSRTSIIISGLLRVVIGLFFIVIGNSFMHRAGLHSMICHPRMSDFTERRSVIHRRF